MEENTENIELIDEISNLLIRAEHVNVKNPFSAYSKLSELERIQKKIAKRIDGIHENLRKEPITISGHGFAPGVSATENSSRRIFALLQIQMAYQNIGAIMDRKHAYVFGYISLYVALISLSFGILSVVI